MDACYTNLLYSKKIAKRNLAACICSNASTVRVSNTKASYGPLYRSSSRPLEFMRKAGLMHCSSASTVRISNMKARHGLPQRSTLERSNPVRRTNVHADLFLLDAFLPFFAFLEVSVADFFFAICCVLKGPPRAFRMKGGRDRSRPAGRRFLRMVFLIYKWYF